MGVHAQCNSKRYHASIGKSVTSFMVGRREKACYLPALQNVVLALNVGSRQRSNTSGVGG
jgi:hypothetical protein